MNTLYIYTGFCSQTNKKSRWNFKSFELGMCNTRKEIGKKTQNCNDFCALGLRCLPGYLGIGLSVRRFVIPSRLQSAKF